MTAEDLRKKVDEAKKIIEKLDLNEPYKSEAFGAILTQLLLKEKVEEKLEEKPKRVEIELEKRIEKLAKSASVTIDKLKQIFDFEEDDLILLTVGEETEKEKQVQATLLILTGLSYCYGKREIVVADLKRKLERLGIAALQNLSTNLSEYPQFVVPKGKRGSRKFGYKITIPGEKEGLTIIRKLVEGGS